MKSSFACVLEVSALNLGCVSSQDILGGELEEICTLFLDEYWDNI
jgi:hypothetical protein